MQIPGKMKDQTVEFGNVDLVHEECVVLDDNDVVLSVQMVVLISQQLI